ncbi:MAG: hypothetical protein HPY57_15950 [Ignavibacteria bacterium]|nr:hypothetical protein [Ignavibacteria bacterium]
MLTSPLFWVFIAPIIINVVIITIRFLLAREKFPKWSEISDHFLSIALYFLLFVTPPYSILTSIANCVGLIRDVSGMNDEED